MTNVILAQKNVAVSFNFTFWSSLGGKWMLSSNQSSHKAQDMYYLEDTLESVQQSIASNFQNIRAFGDAGDITNIEIIQPCHRSEDVNGPNDIRNYYNISEQ
jgi:hypothetical protein